MKKSPSFIAFLQALALTAYVIFISTLIQSANEWFRQTGFPDPLLGTVLFLLIFVLSALICGSIALGLPTLHFMSGKKKEAFTLLGWTIVWLVFFVILAGLTTLVLISPAARGY